MKPEIPALAPIFEPVLQALENCVLTAHIGTSTQEIRAERSALLLANLRAHFAGRRLVTPVA